MKKSAIPLVKSDSLKQEIFFKKLSRTKLYKKKIMILTKNWGEKDSKKRPGKQIMTYILKKIKKKKTPLKKKLFQRPG